MTRDGAVPIQSHAWAENRPDVTQFGTVLDELTSRYRALLENPGDETGTDAGGASPQTTPR